MKKDQHTEDKLLIYGTYFKLINNEKHYTVLQAKYKRMAAYWLLIIFAALGVIFSYQETGVPYSHFISVNSICLFGVIGLLCLWYEDVIIREKFLSINVLKAIKLEEMNPWLPKVHHHQLYFSHKSMLKLKLLFYLISILVLFAVVGIAAIVIFKSTPYVWCLLILGLICIFLILTKFMLAKTYSNDLSILGEDFND